MLIEKGHAYVANGHVLFHVPSMPNYGQLSGHSREELIAGARVDVAPIRRTADFVLWKPRTPEQPGWDSPWGRGRPGWHIECSAMSEAYSARRSTSMAAASIYLPASRERDRAERMRAWQAVRADLDAQRLPVSSSGEKMSKSLGNFFTVRELLAKVRGEAIRLTLLSAHYRQPLDFTLDGLEQSKHALDRLYIALREASDVPTVETGPPFDVIAALEDDLNTPMAMSHLHELATKLNKAKASKERAEAKSALLAAGNVLGLLQKDSEEWFHRAVSVSMDAVLVKSMLDEAEIERKINERNEARKARNFAGADQDSRRARRAWRPARGWSGRENHLAPQGLKEHG